ncbi:nicotinate-nucleotide pyrophosphorylase (carboxylating) [Alkalibacillus flavidus]|uniref:nicotinate-nucleotide diphosphorylase (carboxylating) n=1 Tax=Alkalibacillus flavidus TaxID=546021 RepID=A0ABV2KVW9_9BACI
MNEVKLKQLLQEFFIEDIGDGDITSDSIFTRGETGTLTIHAKETGIFCGASIIRAGYELLDSNIDVKQYISDGESLPVNQPIADVSGPISTLLQGERVILNLIQRLSGIATTTQQAVRQLNDPAIKITDTRKTTPGLRMLEKYAVRAGGGFNHRRRLDDAVLIKDNHIAFAGSVKEAIQRARNQAGHTVTIEVEVESKDQLLEAVEANVDVIMLDNTDLYHLVNWLDLIPDSITVELSGGITLDNLSLFRGLTIDAISMGCLTHHVEAVDISAHHKVSKERV